MQIDERLPPVIALSDPASRELSLTGGKGANLARLVEAGLSVPPGFCVTTAAYRAVVDDPSIQSTIRSLDDLDPDDAASIATIGAEVRSLIREAALPEAVSEAIEDALDTFDTFDTFDACDATDAATAAAAHGPTYGDAYAVRSSATAEDTETASFAGQHETYLAVRGEASVKERVLDCLSSLFTDRAVTYRLRNGVPNADIEMAVVVQAMVEPAVAGVLFTADPVTGERHVATVDASFGLGDAIVAGEVTPDDARVDRRTGDVLDYEVGEKRLAVRSRTDDAGGTETVPLDSEERASRALSDAQLRELVEIGGRIEAILGDPQDVEWALVDGEFVVLQSRPITSLYPLPSPAPADDRLHVYFSFGHQQAMPEALPPLVVDFWRSFVEGGADVFRSDDSAGPVAVEAGGRVYVDLTPVLGVGPLRRAVLRALDALSEPAADGLRELTTRRHGSFPTTGRLEGWSVIARSLRNGVPAFRHAIPALVGGFLRALVVGPPDPEAERSRFETAGVRMAAHVREPDSLGERLRIAFDQFDFAAILVRIMPAMGPFPAAIVAKKALVRLVPDTDVGADVDADVHGSDALANRSETPGVSDDVDAIGRGFAAEVVTRMNQQLGDLADVAREHPEVAAVIEDGATLSAIEGVEGGEAFADRVETFLAEFGHRATGEIDLSRPRWREDPAPLLQTIRGNLARGESGAHRDHLGRLERRADEAATRLEARAAGGVLGPVRRRLVRRLIETYRGGAPLREYPKQGLARLFEATHDVVVEAGTALAADGRLDRPDDVWYLRKDELLAAVEEEVPIDVDVQARRRAHERYASLVAPPLFTSDGEKPTPSLPDPRRANALSGTPVSAGVVDGPAHVVSDPAGATVERGEILVAPSTDPGWTPLFLNTAGLVMEVGGRMTHGALVAREYGIPAVASVTDATSTIRTGERVRVDGDRGTVELLDRE